MRICRVAWMPFRLPFATTFATARGMAAAREGLLLRLESTDGLEGLGEASPLPAFGGGTVEDVRALLHELAPALVGVEVEQAEAVLETLDMHRPGAAAVACAVDTALLDLSGRSAGRPVAALLGGQPGRAIPVNATIGWPDAGAAADAAVRAIAEGFRCVKLKVGLAGSVEAERARIAQVRRAIGPQAALRLDANGAWSPDLAIEVLRAVEAYGIEFVEQPVPADDLEGLARVRAGCRVPVAADEAACTPEQARRVVAAGAADILIVKPMAAGGLRAGRTIIALAAEAGLRALVTTTIDSGVGVAAALHLAAVLPDPPPACGLATAMLLDGDLIRPRPFPQDGTMRVPATPGLGVALDPARPACCGSAWEEVGAG
jgi:o-succinylbenzoate synthase